MYNTCHDRISFAHYYSQWMEGVVYPELKWKNRSLILYYLQPVHIAVILESVLCHYLRIIDISFCYYTHIYFKPALKSAAANKDVSFCGCQ